MEEFSRFNFRLARAIGLLDLHYDEATATIDGWHKESILYGVIWKVFYFASCIYLLIYFKREDMACFGENTIFGGMHYLNDLLSLLNFMIILLETVIKRHLVYGTLATFFKFIQEYRQKITFKNNNVKKNYIYTLMLALVVFSIIPSGVMFILDRKETCETYSSSYLMHNIWFVGLSLCMVVLDAYILSAFLVAYMLLDQVSDELAKHAKEIGLMQHTSISEQWLNMWQTSLTRSISKLSYQQRIIKDLVQDVVNTFWASILFCILNRALKLAFTSINCYILLLESEEYMQYIICVCFVLMMTQSLVLMFYLGQCIAHEYEKMQRYCYESRLQMDMPQSTKAVVLEQCLEALSLELQHEHFRIRFFGIFNIDIATAFSILSATFLHLLLMVQTMMQFVIDGMKEKMERQMKHQSN